MSTLDSNAPILPGEGEDQLISILESITDGFAAFDAEWRFSYLNESARKLLGPHMDGNVDSLVGQDFWEIFPANKGTVLESVYRQAVATGQCAELRYFYEPWSRWYAIRAFPIRTGGLSTYFRDITEEKLAAAALSKSEEKYRLLFNSMDEGFCVVEINWGADGSPADLRLIEVNPAFAQHTGLDDCIGRTIRQIHPEHEEHWFALCGEVAKTGKARRFELYSQFLNRWLSGYAFRISETHDSHRVAILFSDVTERRHTEAEAGRLQAESRERLAELETLLAVMPIGIGIAKDTECKDIRTNPALAEILGLEVSSNASKTAPEEELPQHFRVLDDTGREISGSELPMQIAAREGIESRGVEVNIEHANGRKVRLLEYVAPLFDDEGKPRGSVAAFVDITERRELEERRKFLALVDDTIRPLTNASEIMAAATRLLGEHLVVDRSAYADIDADEDTMNIRGDFCRNVPSIVGRYTFTQFGAEVLQLMRDDKPYVAEDVETMALSSEVLAAYRATQIRSVICVPIHKGGRFVGAMAVHQKTPRRWTEKEVALTLQVANRCWESIERAKVTLALQESDERLRLLADNMAQLAWMADENGHAFWFNERWFEYTGLSPEEMEHFDRTRVHHPAHIERVTAKWRRHLETREVWEDTFPLRGKDGEFRWFLGRALPVWSEERQLLRWFGTHTDITEQMWATEALAVAKNEAERANQAKDDFLAVLSHELRTPLTPALLSVASLEDEEHIPETLRADLAVIRRNIELEARLIDDLLDVTRISRGKMALRLETCDAHAAIQLAVGILSDDIQSHRLTLELDLAAEHCQLQGDPARLQQVFWNILKNAVKFTPAGGAITIRSWNDPAETLVVEVRDSGIGILPDALGRIFHPFDQGGLANDHRYGGLGLGLAISNAIAQLHHGEITAESAGLGKGATLRVVLPVEPALSSVPASTASPPSQPVSDMAGIRVLLVEDHEPTLNVLTRLLRRAGYEVMYGNCANAALELAEQNSFDIVVSDIGLPDATGFELMRTLNDKYGLRGIALTGYGTEEDQNRSKEAGFVHHLTKPVNFSQLQQALSACLSNKSN